MRYFGLLILCLAIPYFSKSQTATDALRYSYTNVGGTARTIGIGGAISALGADFTTLSTNPAGLAAYRKSELVLTPALFRIESEGGLADSPNFKTSKIRFNLENGGVVFAKSPRRNNQWRTSNFAIGVNRIANFNQEFFYQGSNSGSITQRWVEFANNDEFDDFEVNPAIETEAVYFDDVNDTYTSDYVSDPSKAVRREQLINRKGGIDELLIGFAGNYADKLYIGGSVGIPIVNYEEEKEYLESDPDQDVDFFDNLTYTERLVTDGVGANFKLGLIFRLNQMIRFGAAVHTPTVYSLNDSYSTSLNYVYTDADGTSDLRDNSSNGEFDYQLLTPWRFMGSAAVIVGKSGFISAELEWVDYSTAEFDFTENDNSPENQTFEREVNQEISQNQQDALHFRLGGEYAYELFRLRAGIQLNGSGINAIDDFSNTYSFGLGLREKHFFLDMAYKRSNSTESYAPYATSFGSQHELEIENVKNQFLLTFGIKF